MKCRECGGEFATNYPHQQYCGSYCARAGRRKSWRDYKRRQRAGLTRSPPPQDERQHRYKRRMLLDWSREKSRERGVPRWQILMEIGEPYQYIKD